MALIHSRPYHPQTCGKLERFHRTMKDWLAEFPPARNCEELQGRLDEFRFDYNEARPHQGIGDVPPAERYRSAEPAEPAELIGALPAAAYPPGALTRKVSRCGNLSFKGHIVQVGSEWNGYTLRVALIEGVLHIFYGEQLVRALGIDPDVHYYPIGRNRDRIVRGKRGPSPS